MATSAVILLTRPAAASERFAGQLRARFGEVRVIISPAMQIVPVAFEARLAPDTQLIFTSENAVAAFCRAQARRDLAVLCVGLATAEAASRQGFAPQVVARDAAELIKQIQQTPPDGPMLWLRGRDVAADLAEALSGAGVLTNSVICYAADPMQPTDEALSALQEDRPVVLPLFSPRSAVVLDWLAPRKAPLWVAALSPNVAQAAAPLRPDRLVVADSPDAQAMLAALTPLFAPHQLP